MNTTLQHNLGLVEASITNLTCTQNQNGNDTVHAVHWNANGCIKGRTFITFENRWGESVRLQANEGVDRVDRVETNEIQGISVVRVHPEFNLNGDVGQLTSCGEDFVPPERTTSKIYPDSISIINFISRTAISHTTANWLSFGRTFQVYIPAIPGSRLHLVAKLGYTNDYFIGFEDEGLPLFDGDNQAVYSQFAVITHHLRLFDAGTEVDQKPGLGSYQANNTGGPADPLNYVRYASNPYANLPSSISDIVFLDIAPVYSRDGDLEQFKVQMIGNKALAQRSSNPGCDEVPVRNRYLPETYDISHGLILLSDGDNPFMTLGLPDSGLGLEALAEDGNPYVLRNSMAEQAAKDYPSRTMLVSASPTPEQSPHSGALENSVIIITDTLITAILAALLL